MMVVEEVIGGFVVLSNSDSKAPESRGCKSVEAFFGGLGQAPDFLICFSIANLGKNYHRGP